MARFALDDRHASVAESFELQNADELLTADRRYLPPRCRYLPPRR